MRVIHAALVLALLAAPSAGGGTPAALVVSLAPGSTVVVRDAPGGPAVLRAPAQTEFGSPRTFLVVKTAGRWLGVTAPELGNGRIGWIDAAAGGVRTAPTALAVDVDLSERRLTVRSGDRVLRRLVVGIGRPGSPTPTGVFSVTDKLPGSRFGAVYGCCILALSGRQPDLPAGWTGGDRLAIHGTASPASVGGAASAGCLHAGTADLRYLMATLPLGTPVAIRP